ncbi:MAG TPA: sugar ABC transporter permease [Polyangiaceae bacterium]|nr:sugar ABC transporter permease [Polyangiaceae bacterium]
MALDTRQAVGRKAWVPYAFLAPYAVLASIFFLWPFVNAVGLAFYETNGPRSRVFVGLENFRYLANDDLFYSALINTSLFACASVLVQLPLSMGLALLLNSGLSKSKGFFRLILFSPNLVGQIFVGILFSVLFTPRYGLVNRGFQAVIGWGLEQQWLDEPKMAMPALILTSLWLWVGFNMVYFLAALQTVDKTLEEAARIDGANAWQVFFNVTLPSMRHVVVFVLIMSIIGSFQLFELPLAMFHETHGLGPENSGITLITYLNRVAFELGDLGLGAAVGWVVTLVIMGVSLIQLRVTGALKD